MRTAFSILLLTALLAAGCSDVSWLLVVSPNGTGTLWVSSAPACVQVLVRDYSGGDLPHYNTLFTSDFRFAFDPADPSGAEFQEAGWRRDDELLSAAHVFGAANGNLVPGRNIQVRTLGTVMSVPDPRPGKLATWHKQVSIPIELTANLTGTEMQIRTTQVFYMVRGDSARIPPGLSLPADTSHWYIERWEESLPGGGASAQAGGAASPAATMPGSAPSWGRLKALYHR